MSVGSQTVGQQSNAGFLATYGKAIVVIFLALVVFHLPIIGLINLVPVFKEVVLGAAVVAGLTSIADTKAGIKYALVSGMVAAVLFNALYIPGQFLLGGVLGAASMPESAASGAAVSSLMSGFGALLNLVGVVIFSPIGYTVGGALGTLVNQ